MAHRLEALLVQATPRSESGAPTWVRHRTQFQEEGSTHRPRCRGREESDVLGGGAGRTPVAEGLSERAGARQSEQGGSVSLKKRLSSDSKFSTRPSGSIQGR